MYLMYVSSKDWVGEVDNLISLCGDIRQLFRSVERVDRLGCDILCQFC